MTFEGGGSANGTLVAPRARRWPWLLLVLPFVLVACLGWQRFRSQPVAPTRERVLAALVADDQISAERDAGWLAEHARGAAASLEAAALVRLVRHARPDGSAEELARELLPLAKEEGTPATLLARRACLAAVRAKIAQGDHAGVLTTECVGKALVVREPALGSLVTQSADLVVDRCGDSRACALRETRAVEKAIPGLLTRHSVASVQREVLAQLDIATVDAADLPARGQRLRVFVKRADEVAAAVPDEITLLAKASAAIDKASRDGASTALAFATRAELEETFGPFELRGDHLVGHTLARGETVSAQLDPRGKCEGLRMSFPKPIPELWTPEAFVRLALGPRAKLRVAPQGNGEIAWKEGKIPVTATWKDGAVTSISVGVIGAGM